MTSNQLKDECGIGLGSDEQVEQFQVICAECGTSYIANAGDDSLACPLCGPSSLLASNAKIRRRFRIPVPAIPLLLSPVLLAMVLVPLTTFLSQRKSPAPRARLSFVDGQTSDHDLPDEPRTKDNVALNESLTQPSELAERSSDDGVPVVNGSEVTVLNLASHPERLFGVSVHLHGCRYLRHDEKAIGHVAKQYKIDGQTIRIATEEESGYRRMTVLGRDGMEYAKIFVRRDGDVGESLSWLQSGDLIELVGTVGMRFDRHTSTVSYSFIVSEINPAPIVSWSPNGRFPNHR